MHKVTGKLENKNVHAVAILKFKQEINMSLAKPQGTHWYDVACNGDTWVECMS